MYLKKKSKSKGTFTVQFDDGDVRTMTSEGFVRIDKFDTTTPFKAIENTVITCSEKCSQSYPLSSLFDYKHGVKGSKNNEWRVKVTKQGQNVSDNKNGPKKNQRLQRPPKGSQQEEGPKAVRRWRQEVKDTPGVALATTREIDREQARYPDNLWECWRRTASGAFLPTA